MLFQDSGGGCVLGRGEKDGIEEVPYHVPHFGITFTHV